MKELHIREEVKRTYLVILFFLGFPEYLLLVLLLSSSWSEKCRKMNLLVEGKVNQVIGVEMIKGRTYPWFLNFGSGMRSVSSLISDKRGKSTCTVLAPHLF